MDFRSQWKKNEEEEKLTKNIEKKMKVVKYICAKIVFPHVSLSFVAMALSHSAWL